MTDLKPSDVAAEAAVWGLIETEAKKHKDAARAWLAQRMGPDLLAVAAVANGQEIGRASYVRGKTSPRVVDGDAFRRFVEQHYPGEILTTVNPAFQAKLFGELVEHAGVVVDGNGVIVEGVEFVTGSAYVSVTKAKGAREKVAALLAGGRLSLDGIKPFEEPNRWVEDTDAGAIGGRATIPHVVAVCDWCHKAEFVHVVDKPEWDRRHAHDDEQEGGE